MAKVFISRSKSSRRWLDEHFSDQYVKMAQQAGYRSRAVYKLLEIQERDRLIKPGMRVIDLGAAPGGWSQLLIKWLKHTGRVIALDILDMEAIPGVEFIKGDFSDDSVIDQLTVRLDGELLDWVFSDIAPNLSGNSSIDMPRAMYLSELVLDFALKTLKPNGGMLIKVFQGEGFDDFLLSLRKMFKKVLIRKPKASRDRSREIYLLARERK